MLSPSQARLHKQHPALATRHTPAARVNLFSNNDVRQFQFQATANKIDNVAIGKTNTIRSNNLIANAQVQSAGVLAVRG